MLKGNRNPSYGSGMLKGNRNPSYGAGMLKGTGNPSHGSGNNARPRPETRQKYHITQTGQERVESTAGSSEQKKTEN